MVEEKKKGLNLGSFRTKMMACSLITAIIAIMALMGLMIPSFKEEVEKVNQNYMYSTALSYGNTLEEILANVTPDINFLGTPEMVGAIVDKGTIIDVDSSYTYVVDANTGLMLYHPTTDKIGSKVENEVVSGLVEDIANGKTPEPAVVTYLYKGAQKVAAYYYSADYGFILVVTADKDDFYSTVNKITNRAWIICIILLIIAAISVSLISKLQVRPLIDIVDVVNKIGSLDLREDERLEKLKKNTSEAGQVAVAVDSLSKSLREMVNLLHTQSGQLVEAADSLSQGVDRTSKNVNGIENAISEIANGATHQAEQTQRASDEVVSMGDMIEDTSDHVTGLNTTAEMMKESNEIASESLRSLDEINKKAIESIEIIYEETNATNQSTMKIKEATNLIASIAEETNLLSLNASIEAARAGEAGRGFAVVATQISKLADQSNESAKRIDEIIQELSTNSEEAVKTMDEVREIMGQQSENVQKTAELFAQVASGITDSLDGVDRIAGKTTELDGARDSIVGAVQSLSAIAQQYAASTEETSASMTEINTVLETISDDSENLKDIAFKLDESVKRFSI